MAHTLLDLQAFRERLLDARFQGIQSVTDQNGERIVYRSDAELSGAITALDREIAALQAGRKSAIVYINAHKGV
ncbi:phage head-tail joining protein [Frigidibacter mobilis]|uniref:GpW protein n=1 Tax=Frigidibacter mobilis TaxID=1335048 RepID=A0A159Z6E4_9RHOB|nr:hypothetical protein [Frigidibacter mobilis]AMY70912.1 hypothetical protein AKL17_3689 [Frigidibacter mobilis]